MWISILALGLLGIFWRIVTYIAMNILSNPIKPDIRPSTELQSKI